MSNIQAIRTALFVTVVSKRVKFSEELLLGRHGRVHSMTPGHIVQLVGEEARFPKGDRLRPAAGLIYVIFNDAILLALLQ